MTILAILAIFRTRQRYQARVLAVASDGDYGFAVVDGHGDGAELDAVADASFRAT